MIIKIQVEGHSGWWIEDNIAKIHYELPDRKHNSSFAVRINDDDRIEYFSCNPVIAGEIVDNPVYSKNESDFDLCHLDIDAIKHYPDDFKNKDGLIPLPWAVIRYKNNEEKLFVFNTRTYLLNDDGKTIERIY